MWVLDLEDIEKDSSKLLQRKYGTKTSSNKNRFDKGDVLYGKLRPYLNKVIVADEDGFCTTEIVPIKVSLASLPIDANYFCAFLKSPYFVAYANSCSYGVKMPRLGTKDAKAAWVPVPPLEEQQRIVDKLSKLRPLVEAYGKEQQVIELLEGTFTTRLKNSILQEAIQGKLVPQLESEPVTPQIGEAPKNLPFNIPEKWRWVFFGNIVECLDRKRIPIKKSDRDNMKKEFDYYGATGVIDRVDNYIFDERLLLIGEDGANLLSKTKDNAFFAEGKYWVNNHAHVFRGSVYCCLDYLSIYINAISLVPYVTGSAQPKLTLKNLFSIPVPLPPMMEQNRIVLQVEKLQNQIQMINLLNSNT